MKTKRTMKPKQTGRKSKRKTKQETFNAVVNGLIRQGKLGIEVGEGCRYKTSEGAKCAAGQLIPNARYSSNLEGASVSHKTPIGVLIRELGHDVRFVSRLQKLHDAEIFGTDFGYAINSLVELMTREGLDPPESIQL